MPDAVEHPRRLGPRHLGMGAVANKNLLARYASIRGASSFGISYPKVYIDGIEVANSLLVTELDVESVDHVEVIRGPQGAALYGADAISGVINIVTRHDGVDGGAPRAQLQTGAGVAGSTYSADGVLAQRHSLTMRTGTGVAPPALVSRSPPSATSFPTPTIAASA